MRRLLRALTVVLAMTPLSAGSLAQETLYERLGGYPAIAALAKDFVKRLDRDPMFERFFADATEDETEQLGWRIVDLMCVETGGPCVYTGQDIKTEHQGTVTKEEWDRAIALFGESMTKLRVPAQEAQDLATLIVPLESDVVEQQ